MVVGTLMVGAFVSKVLDVSPPLLWWPVLATTVWIIYTIDHLMDGYKNVNTQSIIVRHNYHFKHKKVMLILLVTLSAFTLWASFTFMNTKIILNGIVLFFLIILYFGLVHFFQNKSNHYFHKELFNALAYMAGIILAPSIWKDTTWSTYQILILIGLVLLVWAEGVMASWFDFENDLHDGHKSFATAFTKVNTKYFLVALHIMIFILLKIAVFYINNWLQFSAILIEAVMNLGLLLIILFPKKMIINDRYRILGEMIFWLPGIIWLV